LDTSLFDSEFTDRDVVIPKKDDSNLPSHLKYVEGFYFEGYASEEDLSDLKNEIARNTPNSESSTSSLSLPSLKNLSLQGSSSKEEPNTPENISGSSPKNAPSSIDGLAPIEDSEEEDHGWIKEDEEDKEEEEDDGDDDEKNELKTSPAPLAAVIEEDE